MCVCEKHAIIVWCVPYCTANNKVKKGSKGAITKIDEDGDAEADIDGQRVWVLAITPRQSVKVIV